MSAAPDPASAAPDPVSAAPDPTSRRRELTLAVVGCTAGAALALYAAGQTWAVAVRARPAPLPPLREATTGAQLTGWLPALALVALAGAGALVAVGGRGRPVIGVLLTGCGTGVIVAAVSAARAATGWAVLSVVGGVLVVATGAATLWRGRQWPAMGARYERAGRPALAPGGSGEAGGSVESRGSVGPEGSVGPTDAAMWDALDRGDDPTAAG